LLLSAVTGMLPVAGSSPPMRHARYWSAAFLSRRSALKVLAV